jgi:hypothetical protein
LRNFVPYDQGWIHPINNWMSFDQSLNNARIIFNWCKTTFNWSDIVICALLGNMMRESTMNPSLFQNRNPHPLNGFGLNQWTPWNNLVVRMNALGLTFQTQPTNGMNQLAVFEAEMNNVNNGGSVFGQWFDTGQFTYANLLASTDIAFATTAWLRGYYRAGVEALNQRIQLAEQYYEVFAGTYQHGLQLAVLPVRNLNGQTVTLNQSENGSFSHLGTLAMDFQIWGNFNMPIFAPVDMIMVWRGTAANAAVIWESIRPAMWADGTVDYFHMMMIHDNNWDQWQIGDIRLKGEIFGAAGTAGWVASNGHTHMEVSPGKWPGVPWVTGPGRHAGLPNPTNVWRVFSICDNITQTIIHVVPALIGGTYPWISRCDFIDGETDGRPPGEEGDYSPLIPLTLSDALNQTIGRLS